MSAAAAAPAAIRTVALVGNAPTRGDLARAIDAADLVVRCNGARGLGAETGDRIDDLFLVNRGGAPAEWLEDPDLARRPAVATARRVLLPLDPGSAFLPARRDGSGAVHPDDRDHTAALRAAIETPARAVIALDAAHHERCCRALGLEPGPPSRGTPADAPAACRPSTGFVALHWYLETLPARARVTLHGFGFEGWEGHPWARERAWVEARAREGRVKVVPVEPTGGAVAARDPGAATGAAARAATASPLRTRPGTPRRRSAGSAP